MDSKEIKRKKRAILLQTLNENDDWMKHSDKVNAIQAFVAKELDSGSRKISEQISLSRITEEEFLFCIWTDLDYNDIQKRFKLTKVQLNQWRMTHGFYGKARSELKKEYDIRFRKNE